MKFDIVKTIIAVAASLLVAYAMYAWDKSGNGGSISLVAFIESGMLLTCALGIKIDRLHTMLNIKITAWAFFVICLMMNALFASGTFSVPAFIISNGVVVLIAALIIYSLVKANIEK